MDVFSKNIRFLQIPTFFSLVIFFSLKKLREEVRNDDNSIKKKVAEDQNTGYGYGGKYGVEKDRMDKVRQKKIILIV